ncbi:MAG: hypothetical protein IKQ25_09150 [Lachnospiraceae bacterium]|nr:hypothetical protein [Lachnospiraceae bacterium]MBR6151435.1 hypothetical protein [Lachnospiraceae bacterium]
MAYKMERLTCPGCGFPVEIGMKECPAGHPLNISTFTSVYDMPLPLVNKYTNTYQKDLVNDPSNKELNHSIGICYLKLKLYDKAISAFERAMEDNFDNSETFFYAAIALLRGKKAFLALRSSIDKAEEYINAALMIEPKGIYYYFLAYIKYDFFERKFLNTSPNYKEALHMANDAGLSEYDIQMLYGMLNVERPSIL